MQESLETLERERDGPGDEVLAAMVRLQLLGDEAHKLLLRDVAAAGAEQMGAQPSTETPSFVFRKNMVQRLQNIKEKISAEAASNCKYPPPPTAVPLYSADDVLYSADDV